MQDVPKIVREWLKAAPAPVDHPDPDILTAFAEHSLPQSERAAVMVHLSCCVDCRDIVALALPPTEATQPMVTPSRSGWLTWPALRWGFVAVGVVAVALVGVVQYQRGKSIQSAAVNKYVDSERAKKDEARNQTPPPTAVTQPLSTPEKHPSATDKDLTRSTERSHSAAKQIDTAEAPKSSTHVPQRGLYAGGLMHGSAPGGPAYAWQQQQTMRQQVPSASTTTALQVAPSVNVPAAAPPPAPRAPRPQSSVDQNQVQTGDVMLAQNQPGAQTAQDEAKVVRSKPSETVEVAAAAPVVESNEKVDSEHEMPKVTGEPVNGRSVSALVALKPTSQLRWTIGPTGNLQRSYDQGGTWQDVNVIAGLIPTSNFAAYGANTETVVRAKKATKSNGKRDIAGPVFRVVTAAGSDVWAGGSNTALYHSTDGGDHWMQVLPSSGGIALTGDVVALEFSDPQHGKVATSTSETWITSDAGQSWQKQ